MDATPPKASWLGLGFLVLTRISGRMRSALWRWWYNSLARRDQDGALLFMNYGYADPALQVSLEAADEPYRYPIQLYEQTVAGIALAGKTVVEVGCGRGGGASYLARTHQPTRMVGVDLSQEAIAWCRSFHKAPNAEWCHGSASALPLEDASVDVVVNVESSHCYPSMADFVAEVVRVLRPGGEFAFCDLRLPSELAGLDQCFADAGLEVLERRMITPQVVEALGHMSEQRASGIARLVPRPLQKVFGDFAAVRGSSTYGMLQDGRMVYISMRLRKPL